MTRPDPHRPLSATARAADRVIQRKRRDYEDMSSQGNVQRLNDTLYDVHNVMRDNLQHVLKRGKKLDRAPAPAPVPALVVSTDRPNARRGQRSGRKGGDGLR